MELQIIKYNYFSLKMIYVLFLIEFVEGGGGYLAPPYLFLHCPVPNTELILLRERDRCLLNNYQCLRSL